MIKTRWNWQGLLLSSGKVLIAGGFGGFVPNTAELYDPATGTWSDAGTMVHWRHSHALVELADGRVLAAGGREDQGGQIWASAEIYDPTTKSWALAPSMGSARLAPVAARLANGHVMVAGGYKTTLPLEQSTTEIFDPNGKAWTAGPSMTKPRYEASLTRLSDGKLLVVSSGVATPNASTSEYYDPGSNAFVALSNMNTNHSRHSATLLTDGRVLVAGGGNIESAAKLFAFAANGQSCTVAADCQSGECVEGVCCSSACTGPCESCLGSKTGGASGTCAPIAANTDPDAECGACKTCNAGACAPVAAGADPKNDCKDSGSPSCQDDGSCDGAGACAKYAVSAGCTPVPCTSGSQCASGFCRDGVCCDAACSGVCQACTAAKKGSGVDGVCEPVAMDTDPDDECAEGPNFPTSCLADGMCDGSGACRVFAKDTVSCGATQCVGGAAQGLLCNGAGSCVTATKSCEPYICESNQCLQACSDANDCASGSFCSSSGACLPKQANGLACTAGKECQSGFCADGICCDQACSGQCEACNVSPNEGTCSPVIGEPVGARPACEGQGECGGACDGVDRTACKVPPSGKPCGTPSCALDKATASKCDGLGACVAQTDDCSPFSCGSDACRSTCSASDHCAEGFVCNPETGNCVPAAGKCASDGVTLELASGETKSCSPYRCLGGECADPCATSSQCVAGFACDQGECVALDDAAGADEGGCGCRTGAGTETRGLGFWALLLALALAASRRRGRAELSL
jgi:MYXO-CTERM domain-containing protein